MNLTQQPLGVNVPPLGKLTSKYSHAVEVYEQGIRCHAPSKGGKNDHSGKHKRGDISGWSKSSRRRMRALLMEKRLPEEFHVFAVTLTIPGYPLSPGLAHKLFEKFRIFCRDKKWATIWRVELQKRGQLHWHCILGTYPEYSAKMTAIFIEKCWHHCLRSMGILSFNFVGPFSDPTPTKSIQGSYNLMDLKGADRYSARVDYMPDQDKGWIRYLIDHTTKHKQEQIPENIGRHWGVICRKLFVNVYPADSSTRFTAKQYAKFIRVIRRMYTPYIRCDTALFGRRRGYTSIRATQGKTDIFTKNNATIERVINYALN